MTASARHRTFVRAARLWAVGRYHEAIDVLDDAGLGHERAAFVRFAQQRNRDRYQRIMSRYQP